MEQLIRNGLEAMDLLPQTPDRAPAQLAEYGRLLLEKNQVMNLTAITEPERVAPSPSRRACASLSARAAVPLVLVLSSTSRSNFCSLENPRHPAGVFFFLPPPLRRNHKKSVGFWAEACMIE